MRFVRIVWPLVFLVPLVPLAGRFCNVLATDAIYHLLIYLHERLPLIIATLVSVSLSATLLKLARARSRLHELLALASPSPKRLTSIAGREADLLHMSAPRIIFLDVDEPLCFASIGGPLIMISRGFVAPLSDEELTLVLRHELAHVRHRDPLRGTVVHLAFGALLVPGFQAIERALYLKREAKADQVAARSSRNSYDALLVRLSRMRSPHVSICRGVAFDSASPRSPSSRQAVGWTRFVPAGAASALIVGVLASHAFFDEHLNYLLSHHC